MKPNIYVVDAFTSQPFSGNPAGVCLLDGPADETWMKLVAREMALSETAFLHRVKDGFALRWFTPAVEVDLCGHATLGSAHTLWENGILMPDQEAVFHTRSGRLSCRRAGDWIEMNFPAKPAQPCPAPPGLSEALGARPVWTGKSAFDYLIELGGEQEVRNLKPNFSALGNLPVRGIIVTAQSQLPEFDFVSRFFAPASGINEDPVTGSAHCTLAPFWQERLGKADLNAFQASARGGVLKVSVRGDRVLLRGQAVMMSRVEMLCAS